PTSLPDDGAQQPEVERDAHPPYEPVERGVRRLPHEQAGDEEREPDERLAPEDAATEVMEDVLQGQRLERREARRQDGEQRDEGGGERCEARRRAAPSRGACRDRHAPGKTRSSVT